MITKLAVLLFAAGLLVRGLPRRRHWSPRLVAVGAGLALFFSLGNVAQALLWPLEHRFPPQPTGAPVRIDDIVLLTAWSGDDASLPAGSRLNDSATQRVLATLALWRGHGQARVIISGEARTAGDMRQALMDAGVPSASLLLEPRSADTAQSAANCAPLLQGRRFALVTSAGHLPRAMGSFQKLGLAPVPVPTDYRLPGTHGLRGWLPSLRALQASDLAVHEYLGLAWYRMRGRL